MREIIFLCLFLGGCNSVRARLVAQQAVDLYKHGQIAQAAKKFEEAAVLDDSIAAIQIDLGFASLALYQSSPLSPDGRKASGLAVAAFKRYLELKPNEERAKSYLVQTFSDTGRYDEAVAYFGPKADKGDGESLALLGTIASKTGRFSEALEWYEKRIKYEPENAEARLQIAVLAWDHLHAHPEIIGADRLARADGALKHLEEARRLKPKWPNPYTYTNLVYRERSYAQTTEDGKRIDLEQANKFFQEARELERQQNATKKGKQ